MKKMIDDNYLKLKLIGLDCWSSYLTYPNALVLNFGNKIEYLNQRSEKKYEGEFNFRSDFSIWRIRDKENYLCGSYLLEEENESILQNLNLGKLLDFKQTKNDDFLFVFENSYEIDILCSTNDENMFTVSIQNEEYVSFNQKNKWIIESLNESITSMTETENIISEHSFDCRKRWESIIPKNKNDYDFCKDCFYYLPISGTFYFFDFGLCSNSKSNWDGKVVEAKSSCEFFNEN